MCATFARSNVIDRVAARVRAAVVLRARLFSSPTSADHVSVNVVSGKELIGRRLAAGRLPHVLVGLRVRDDFLRRRRGTRCCRRSGRRGDAC